MHPPSPSLPLIALVLGVAGYVLFSIFKPVTKPFVSADSQQSAIDFVDLSQNSVRSDQALLQDSAPLFLPTRWNASTSPQGELGDEIINVSIHPPELHASVSRFFEEGPTLAFARQPSPVFSEGLATPFSTLGTASDEPVNRIENNASSGTMVIRRVGFAESLHLSLPNELLSSSKTGIWSPVEFFCTVENLTSMGSPSQTKFSGINDLDAALSHFAKQQVSDSGLPAGFYRITAFP